MDSLFFFISLFIQSLPLQWKLHLPFIKVLYLPYCLFCRCLKDRRRSQKEGGEEATAREAKLGGSAVIRQRFLIYHVHVIFSSAKKKKREKKSQPFISCWSCLCLKIDGNVNARQPPSSLQAMMLDADGACLSPSSKPHICEHCSAAFRSSYHLRRHVLIHTGERISLLSVLSVKTFVLFSLCTSCPCLETKPAARNVKRPR